jgi:hypothetical protein
MISPLVILLWVLAGVQLSAQGILDAGGNVQASPAPADEAAPGEDAQDGSAQLPLKRIALFSSGVGYFEHTGRITGNAAFPLSFPGSALNDVLKSLAVSQNAPGSSPPSISYPSGDSLYQTLRSLKIDLSGNPGIPEILQGLRGAELEAQSGETTVRGRILGVEYRSRPHAETGAPEVEILLSLSGEEGIQSLNLKDVTRFSFTDPAIAQDLNRALDLIAAERGDETKELLVRLPGNGSRDGFLSYVIPVPVWKVSYRLDLSPPSPAFQGWAIIDNDGDRDWNQVEISLVSGRPVSFIQNLYAPYYLSRPVVPLAIPGAAQGRAYASGSPQAEEARNDRSGQAQKNENLRAYSYGGKPEQEYSEAPAAPQEPRRRAPLPTGTPAAARGSPLGEQFEFTLPGLITLERRQSAMVPLVNASIRAEKTLVYTAPPARRDAPGRAAHPAVCVELTNTTGLTLPPGPITVYDKGAYAGDALIEFFPEQEKRLIAYGEDLAVSVSSSGLENRSVTAVTVSKGVMTINRKQRYETAYAVRNAGGESKQLIIEHPITQNTALAEPKNYREKTDTLYRFNMTVPAKQTASFTVREESPLSEQIILAQLRFESFLGYAANQELPPAIRAGLNRAVELRKAANDAKTRLADLESQKSKLAAEQDRIRRNLEAAGGQSPQGQNYLNRLLGLDRQIDETADRITAAAQEVKDAQEAFDQFLGNLSL